MGEAPQGVLGVDLYELNQIKAKLLKGANALGTADTTIRSGRDFIFSHSASVGDHSAVSNAWISVAQKIDAALSESETNLRDTRTAIDTFLKAIFEADEGAKTRMETARKEAEGN